MAYGGLIKKQTTTTYSARGLESRVPPIGRGAAAGQCRPREPGLSPSPLPKEEAHTWAEGMGRLQNGKFEENAKHLRKLMSSI